MTDLFEIKEYTYPTVPPSLDIEYPLEIAGELDKKCYNLDSISEHIEPEVTE